MAVAPSDAGRNDIPYSVQQPASEMRTWELIDEGAAPVVT